MEKHTFCVMIDCSRNGVMTVGSLKKFIGIIARMGYNALMLYTEDTYEIEGEEYFGLLRGGYTAAEIRELDAYAFSIGVELIPCIQTLAHLDTLLRWHRFEDLRDFEDTLLVGEKDVYALIEKMIKTISENFTSRRIHIGMDEAFNMGRGKFFEKHGFLPKDEIFKRHYVKVREIIRKYGYESMIWGDTAVDADYKTQDTIICWDYYTEEASGFENKLLRYKATSEKLWYAGGVITWLGYAPYNKFSSIVTDAHLSVCKKHGVQDVIITLWGDDGKECSYFSALPALFSIATTWTGKSMGSRKKKFKEIVGIDYDDMCLLDILNDVGEDIKWQNPNKYLFYQDLFFGIYDSTIGEGYSQKYKENAERLRKIKACGDFAYLFETGALFCDVLQIKCSISKRLRKAYTEKNTTEIGKIIFDCENLSVKLKAFYESFKRLWYTENKCVGFEVMDIRLGGLMRRVETVKERLCDYFEGRIESIEELEQKNAIYYSEEFIGKAVYAPEYKKIVTVNRL